jgi:hypothetical protein
VKQRVSWLSLLSVLFALSGCVLAAAIQNWSALAVCLTVSGAVAALLSLRETQ